MVPKTGLPRWLECAVNCRVTCEASLPLGSKETVFRTMTYLSVPSSWKEDEAVDRCYVGDCHAHTEGKRSLTQGKET